jgi:hypothetical protein
MIQATSTRSRLALGTSFAASMAVRSGRPSGCVTFTVCRTLCLPESAFVRMSLSQNDVVRDKRRRIPPNSNHREGGRPIGDLRLAVTREKCREPTVVAAPSVSLIRFPAVGVCLWEHCMARPSLAVGKTPRSSRQTPNGGLFRRACVWGESCVEYASAFYGALGLGKNGTYCLTVTGSSYLFPTGWQRCVPFHTL